jgi:hypothetical protein
MKGFLIGSIVTMVIGVIIFLQVKFKFVQKIIELVKKIKGGK